MKKEEAIKQFFPSPDDTVFGINWINSIYKDGYVILSPEEMKKVDSVIVIADVHGMNPFKPKEK